MKEVMKVTVNEVEIMKITKYCEKDIKKKMKSGCFNRTMAVFTVRAAAGLSDGLRPSSIC